MQSQVTTPTDTNSTLSALRFELGRLYITPGAIDALEESGESAQTFISRHVRLEQGELCDEDYSENLYSVSRPLRIFSAFKTANGVKVWVITEANRSSTTLLLPSEY